MNPARKWELRVLGHSGTLGVFGGASVLVPCCGEK